MRSEYIEYRRIAMELNNRIVKTIKSHELNLAGKSLDMLVNDIFVFENEDETGTLMDRAIFDVRRGNKNVLTDFIDSTPPENFSKKERRLLEGMSKAWFSLFQVNAIDPREGSVHLDDLIHHTGPFKLFDIGLSQSILEGDLIATRLIPIDNWHMTSGVGYPFMPYRAAELLAGLKRPIHNSKKRKYKIVPPEDYSSYFFREFKRLREGGIIHQNI
ncbi:MAG: hypothetical protein ONB44_17270 [candidate division KSB1 bacterium]|nr:hypothetical protein [candidate division KSB1 bacterium]MDZ7303887.1 hypothetical protein [candidate division KSB1 bacterium]MDZ7313189.1 hypothetical protein [candidate division KSB1 bacterium]